MKIQYNRNRYLDYYAGRWLTEDPLGIVPNAQSPNVFGATGQYKNGKNLYEYAGSNPGNRYDVFGLKVKSGRFIGRRGLFDAFVHDTMCSKANRNKIIKSDVQINIYPNEKASACCEKIVFGQIVKTYALFEIYGLYFSEIIEDWKLDYAFPYPVGDPWVKGDPYGSLGDEPGFENNFAKKVASLKMDFESCAICIKGAEKGANYGCVKWGHSMMRIELENGDLFYSVTRYAFNKDCVGILNAGTASSKRCSVKVKKNFETPPSSVFHNIMDSRIP